MTARRNSSAFFRIAASAMAASALSGCLGVPDLRETAAPPPGLPPERAAAIAEIRAEAAAGEHGPFPDVFQTERTARLAARGEPLSTTEVEAIQTELALIAERRATVTDAREIAALERRARELRRLVLKAGAQPIRR